MEEEEDDEEQRIHQPAASADRLCLVGNSNVGTDPGSEVKNSSSASVFSLSQYLRGWTLISFWSLFDTV